MRLILFCFAEILLSVSINSNANQGLTIADDSLQSQIDRKLGKIDNPSHFELYTTYLTKISYAGRYYGTSGIGLYPSLAYKHKSGFAAGISNYVWTGFSPAFCQSVGSISYSKDFLSWMGAGIEYSRNWMYYGTDSDKREMPNSINLNLGIYLGWFNVSIDYGYMFGYEKASGLHTGLNHDFEWYHVLGADKISISPSAGAFWGPQTIFYHYFSKNTIKKINRGKSVKSNGKGNSTMTTTSTFEEDSQFQTLAYQAGVAFNYRLGRFDFEIAYRIDVPMNLPVDYQYGSSPLTYFNGSLKYKF